MKSRRVKALGLFLAITATGLLWRFAPLHLPYFAWKYGGSMLWAAGMYWLLSAAAPRLRPTPLALLTAVLAALVEFSRLLHPAWLDHFRHTLAGKLTLGSVYSPRNIVAYWVGVGLAVWLDERRPRG